MKPMTARCSVCSISVTPAARIASPPTPVRTNGARASVSARATPAPCRSPDTSPATKTISRTVGERRQRTLDLPHDGQRHGQRLPPIVAAHGTLLPAANGRQEVLHLQPERLALGRRERNPLDE